MARTRASVVGEAQAGPAPADGFESLYREEYQPMVRLAPSVAVLAAPDGQRAGVYDNRVNSDWSM